MHAESAVRALHEQRLRHREDVIHAAAIRAMVCASRGLAPSTGCLLPGVAKPGFAQGQAGPALGAFLSERDDTEGIHSMTDTKLARQAAIAIESKGWVNGVPQLLHRLADHIEHLQSVAHASEVQQAECDRLPAQVDRLKAAIKEVEARQWVEHGDGERLSALCLEAAGRVDDGETVSGLSELLRSASKRLQEVGA